MEQSTLLHIAIAVAFAVITLIAQHYFPWHKLIGRELPRPAAYTLGTLAMIVPFTVLLVSWRGWWPEAVALWAIVVASGLTVGLMYLWDALHTVRTMSDVYREEAEVFRAETEEV